MKKSMLLILLFIGAWVVRAQEVCNNGIDDDGDGFIDCYDSDCSVNSACKGFFLGNDALCQAVPSQFPKFSMQLDFSSADETTNHLSRIAIGDLDRDGVPEIVTMNRYTDELIMLNGSDGSIKKKVNAGFEPYWEIAIANIKNDNCAEIFFIGREKTGKKSYGVFFYAYDCNLNRIWKSLELDGDPINYGLADFDGDGKVELYAKDEIYDAETGTRIIKTKNWDDVNGGPVAVDMDGDNKLDLVLGLTIYTVNLGARTQDAGSLVVKQNRPEYFIRYDYNATSVADYNQDGFLDVIASGSTISKGTNTTVFFWDVHNNTLKTYSDPLPALGNDYKNGWKNGTGRINIADLDGDGKLNASYVSGRFLYALNENFNLFWKVNINEETSGYTGCTLFDFNGDGKSEIVYRDEQFIYIIDGTNGSIYNQQPCISRTNREYPIVADVDADGSTELCVTCGFDDATAWAKFNDLSYSQYSHVRVFKSAGEPWVPARRLWNQHGYFNVNVNDDLTIPKIQQKHHLVWSTGGCTTGPNRPLNGFLNQSPFLDSRGCPTYASPDLAYVNNSMTVTPPTCPDKNFTVTFQVENLGDIPLSGSVPITFYKGDPTLAGATKLNTVNINLNNLDIGDTFATTNLTVNGPGSMFTLYIVLNDGGTTVPTPISLPNTNFLECDYGNNIISASITPLSNALTALTVQDNTKCLGSTAPDNGAVRAFVPVGGVENIADYKFYWSNGTTAKPIGSADFVGPVYSGLVEGTYTVYAVHKTAGCTSDTVQVVVGRINNSQPVVSIVVDKAVTTCKNPNGTLRAVVNGGAPVGDFEYTWYEGNDVLGKQIGVSNVITNLDSVVYTVLVRDKVTGCESVESMSVPSSIVTPALTTSKTDALCTAANSGSATATIGGQSAGFTFSWYNGNNVKPAPDFTGSNYNNLPGGNYTVFAKNNSSKCNSDTLTISIVQTSAPVASVSVTSQQTSCDPALPNGGAQASVGGQTAGYTFAWFNGQSTAMANKIAGQTSSTIGGLKSGTYTVKIRDATTGCFDTEEFTITNSVVIPSLTPSISDNTTCNPNNGSISIAVDVDAATDYTFSWYDGAVVKATPDYAQTGNTLSALMPGQYTVVGLHNTKHCETAPVVVTVNNAVPAITLNASVIDIPSDCSTPTGRVQADISAPGNTLGFDIEWYAGKKPFAGPALLTEAGVTSTQLPSIASGTYTVIATNNDNGCQKSKSLFLPFANPHFLDYVTQDQVENCVPGTDGNMTVNLTKTALAGFSESNYQIFIYAGENDPGSPGPALETIAGVAGVTQYTTSTTLAAGFYTLVAVSNNPTTMGCRVPLTEEILQNTTNPVIDNTATQVINNSFCNYTTTGSGQITLIVDDPLKYSFSWFAGPDDTSPPLATTGGVNNKDALNLIPGFYTVRVTNTTASSTGCFTTKKYSILDEQQVVTVPASGGLITSNVTSCDPSNGMALTSGQALVVTIDEDGSAISAPFAGYSFEWYDAADNLLADATPPPYDLAALASGSYYVKAINASTNCNASLDFTILDQATPSTMVDLIDFKDPKRCIFNDPTPDEQVEREGFLQVSGTGTSTSGYSYEWHQGTLAGAVIGNTATLTPVTVPDDYAIKVINNDNDCWALDTYTVGEEVVPVYVTASASPLSNCNPPNGVLLAASTNDGADDQLKYTFSWYQNGMLLYTGRQINGPAYSPDSIAVVAVDSTDPICISDTVKVLIQDLREYPKPHIMQDAPVTNCDATRPNGVASADVDGDFISFTFDWFEGGTTASPLAYTGASFDELKANITYTVLATNNVTGCADTALVSVPDSLVFPPSPDIEVLSHLTSCIDDNGEMSVSVDGVTQQYVFNWYIGTIEKAGADFVGEIFSDLAVGPYSVTATDRTTGCKSQLVTDDILDERIYPDFNFITRNSSCDQSDGYASLFMTTSVSLDVITWEDSNGVLVASGPNYSNALPGVYTVTVLSVESCSTSKDIEIAADIHPFNGVSKNGDGQNDVFYIDCIQNFPSNVVRIYNRAGTLVFQGDGYNNSDVVFDGISNRGVSPMGTNLPDGTYFFIIDKRDGTKPLSGYLEIVD